MFASVVQRRPVLAMMLLVVIALIAARCHGPIVGCWDGPI
jgi:hypothetical protein